MRNRKQMKKPPRKDGAVKKNNVSAAIKDLVPVRIKKHRDKKGGHPHVILEDIDDKHVSVGLTRDSKKGKNSTNYKCEINPLGGKDTTYMRRQGTVARKDDYLQSEKKGKMSPKDYAKAKEYGDKAKQKYLDGKKSE